MADTTTTAATQPSDSTETAPTNSTTSSTTEQQPAKKKFQPKTPVNLNPPKDDPFTVAQLTECDGTTPSKPTLVAIKGTIFDVSGNKAYAPGGGYHVFAGKDPSLALAKTSLKPEDCRPIRGEPFSETDEIDRKERGVLDDWYMFFEARYNIVGKVVEG